MHECSIYVKDVLLRGMDKGKVEFGPQMYRVVRSDKHYSGEISVAVTFTKVWFNCSITYLYKLVVSYFLCYQKKKYQTLPDVGF